MSGNDIVDRATAAAESNWKRKGFLEKIFTPQEQQYIHEAASPGEMVWKLWSMKESAYKIYTRQYGGRFFAPQKFNCKVLTGPEGKVEINKVTYHTITQLAENYIYSIARPVEQGKASFVNCCFRITEPGLRKQQEFINERMILHYAMVSGKERNDIEIIKDRNGIPLLYCSQDKLSIPVSITHHGNYAAFTIY